MMIHDLPDCRGFQKWAPGIAWICCRDSPGKQKNKNKTEIVLYNCHMRTQSEEFNLSICVTWQVLHMRNVPNWLGFIVSSFHILDCCCFSSITDTKNFTKPWPSSVPVLNIDGSCKALNGNVWHVLRATLTYVGREGGLNGRRRRGRVWPSESENPADRPGCVPHHHRGREKKRDCSGKRRNSSPPPSAPAGQHTSRNTLASAN